MAISREEVEHVARLARLGLDEDEIENMTGQLAHILTIMQSLNSLDTSAIPPTAQVIPLATVMREDAPRPSWPLDEIERNAPRIEHNEFLVPAILDE